MYTNFSTSIFHIPIYSKLTHIFRSNTSLIKYDLNKCVKKIYHEPISNSFVMNYYLIA